MIVDCLTLLIFQLDSSDRDNMFNMCVQWLNSEDVSRSYKVILVIEIIRLVFHVTFLILSLYK